MDLSWLFWWRPPCLLSRVLVTQQSDPDIAIRGVLWRSRGAWLVLREPELTRPRLNPRAKDDVEVVALGGEVVIHRSNVAYLQVLHADHQ